MILPNLHPPYWFQLVETWWAIGSSRGGTDIQPFINIGTNVFASNDSLTGLLLDGHTYYVTLKCTNGAGLTAMNVSEGETHTFILLLFL